ncbi:MAG TPA: FAD-binding protein [Rhizomicrobium sp.]|nr:FAD-binding protein [Rhizomicrobium sp.]
MARLSVSSETEVVDVVRAARDARRTLEIAGHGTKRGLGRPVECDDVLDLSQLSGVVKYEPDEMVITARAGTPVAEIEAALAEKDQRLGFEPADWGPLYGAPANAATIGGVLAADANGSAAIRYGRCRDHLLGFRAVNGFGEAYKAGGKVVKNVTGFDVPKLMCGAMGTLGPMTEVTLRAFPRPPISEVFDSCGLSPERGFALLLRAWSRPLESTGLAFVNGVAFVRLEGSRAALDEKIKLLRKFSETAPQAAAIFHNIASGRIVSSAKTVLWRVHIPPMNAANFIAETKPAVWCADWAGGLLWVESDRYLHAIAWEFDARAIRMRGDKSIPPFAQEDPVRAELTKRVKAAFDPLRLFNPGRMWDGV